jgi:hypothetical protein
MSEPDSSRPSRRRCDQTISLSPRKVRTRVGSDPPTCESTRDTHAPQKVRRSAPGGTARGHIQIRSRVGTRYGYQWWLPDAGDHAAFAAIGWGGQLVEVVPDLRLVVVVVTGPISSTNFMDDSLPPVLVKLAVIPHVHTTSS